MRREDNQNDNEQSESIPKATISTGLDYELRIVQNPALGAALLWRLSVGYAAGSEVKASTPLPLLYIALPLILHNDTCDMIITTRESSGLRFFADKLTAVSNSQSDILFSIHDRSHTLRRLTTTSLRLGLSTRLFALIPNEGAVIPLINTMPSVIFPDSIRQLMLASYRLGVWFANLSIYEIGLILKVAL